MAVEKLPSELLREIFLYVEDQSDLNNAALVCHSWLPLCREVAWGRITLNLDSNICSELACSLREKERMAVPRKIGGVVIDEFDVIKHTDPSEISAWRENLEVLLDHFDSISHMTIKFLVLSAFSRPVEGILRPGTVTKSLVIQQVTAMRPSDILPYILGNPQLEYLDLGSYIFLDKDRVTNNSMPPTDSIRLPRLRHLVVSGTYEELLPCFMNSCSLSSLKTLVVICHDYQNVLKLVNATLPSLHSLGIGFPFRHESFDLRQAASLRNLSINIGLYPMIPGALEPLIETVSSVPNLEHLFIDCVPSVLHQDQARDRARGLWRALDLHLIQLPNLKYVAFTSWEHSAMRTFRGQCEVIPGGDFMGQMEIGGQRVRPGDFIDDWKLVVLGYARYRLPSCYERKLVCVKGLDGSWTSHAFADATLAE